MSGERQRALWTDHERLDWIITELAKIPDELWRTDTVRETHDGVTTNCVMGHIFDIGGGDEPTEISFGNGPKVNGGGLLWDWFEDRWATTYMIYPVNDGERPDYPQPTPRERCLAYLRDLRDGKAKSTEDLWAEDEALFDASVGA